MKANSSTAEATPVSTIMTRDVVTIARDASIANAIERLVQHGISGLPVVDEETRPLGLISKTDVLRYTQGAETLRTVGDVMTPLALSVDQNVSIARAAALMAVEGVHRIVVTTDDGALVGILSSLDVMAWLARREGYVIPP